MSQLPQPPKRGRGRPRKPVDLFDLGFPVHSRSGLQQINQQIIKLAHPLGDMQARAAFYGQTELEALADPLLAQWSKIMGPAELTAKAATGQLNVLHQAALGKADVELMIAKQRAEAMAERLAPQGVRTVPIGAPPNRGVITSHYPCGPIKCQPNPAHTPDWAGAWQRALACCPRAKEPHREVQFEPVDDTFANYTFAWPHTVGHGLDGCGVVWCYLQPGGSPPPGGPPPGEGAPPPGTNGQCCPPQTITVQMPDSCATPCPEPPPDETIDDIDYEQGDACSCDVPGYTYGPSWPDHLAWVIKQCESLADSLWDGPRLKPNVVASLVAAITQPACKEAESYLIQAGVNCLLTDQAASFDSQGALGAWNKIAETAIGNTPQEAMPVLSVRAVITYLHDLACSWGREKGRSDGRGLSLGVEAFRLGVSATTGRADSRHGGIVASIKPFLVFGIEILDQCVKMLTRIEFPGVREAMAMWLAGELNDAEFRLYADANGARSYDWGRAARAARRKPEIIDSFILRNREITSDKQLDIGLRNLGFTDQVERSLIPHLRFEVPGPSDLVRFAVRHVFEPDLVKHFGYDDEYRPILDAFHHAQGIDYPIFSSELQKVVNFTERANHLPPDHFLGLYQQAGIPEPTWARAYWWSHWILPSPGMGYSMLQRLRPTGGVNGGPRDESGQVFTREDLNLLLRANDYPPFWREKLSAISYRLPSIRFLRVSVQTATITEKEAVEQLQDMGYRPRLAAQMARALVKQQEMQEAAKLLKIIEREVTDAWELGLVSNEQFVRYITDAGIDQREAEARLGAATAKRSTDTAKRLVAAVHKAYLRGRYSWDDSARFLGQIGIVPLRISDYQVEWTAERESSAKDVTAGQLRKAVITGVLDLASYAQRLRNLDYTDDAILLLLADARLALATAQTKSLEKVAKEAASGERAHLAALRALAAQQRELRAELARHGSPAKLKTWFCNGDISGVEVTSRLRALDWPQDDIDRLLGECDAKREKAGLSPYSPEAPGAEA